MCPRRKYSEDANHNEVINKLYASIRQLQNENRQLKLALGAQKINCTWEQFISDIKRKNKAIAAILEQAHVRRFEQGRIWLAFRGLRADLNFIARYELKNFLSLWALGKFGCPFVIKIKFLD